MSKFKKGDLVEIIQSSHGNKGHRFVVGEHKSIKLRQLTEKCYAYRTDIPNNIVPDRGKYKGEFLWSPEAWLKLVNPDNGSGLSFTEVLDNMKTLMKEKGELI